MEDLLSLYFLKVFEEEQEEGEKRRKGNLTFIYQI